MKNFKLFTTVLLTLIIVFGAFSLVSCDNEVSDDISKAAVSDEISEDSVAESAPVADDDKVTYNVTVIDQDGAPVEGVIIQFCDDENCKLPVMTDADGKASASYEESNYHITITQADGYDYEETYNFEDGATDITITINLAQG